MRWFPQMYLVVGYEIFCPDFILNFWILLCLPWDPSKSFNLTCTYVGPNDNCSCRWALIFQEYFFYVSLRGSSALCSSNPLVMFTCTSGGVGGVDNKFITIRDLRNIFLRRHFNMVCSSLSPSLQVLCLTVLLSEKKCYLHLLYPRALQPFDSHGRLARWRKWKSCDVGEAKVELENQLWRSSAHSPTFPSLHLRHNSFSNPSVALPT